MGGERVACWEFMKCNVYSNCPVYHDQGRIRFAGDGTQGMGETQGGIMEKFGACKGGCGFYPTLG